MMMLCKPRKKRFSTFLAGALVLVATLVTGQALWLQAKAWLAQRLIASAWQQTLASGAPVKPWPWADTWPVARLTTPQGRHLYVLASVSGQALAFGPGHLSASALPGEAGTVLIAGHQDSHLAFLEQVKAGDALALQGVDGQIYQYRVAGADVVDSSNQHISLQYGTPELRLVTCYPFASLQSGGPLRYVVTAWLEEMR